MKREPVAAAAKPVVLVGEVPGAATKRAVIVGDKVELKPSPEFAWMYQGGGSIGEVIVETEILTVTGQVALPGAQVLIQTRFLTFSDTAGSVAGISVQPLPVSGQPPAALPTEFKARNGQDGAKGPNFFLYAERIEAAGNERRLDLRGGTGQDAGEGREGIGKGSPAVASGAPGAGGAGGTFYGAGDLGFLHDHDRFVDTSGGANGGKGHDYKGGPGAQWRVRDGGFFGAVFNTGHIESIPPGADALAPGSNKVAANGAVQPLEQVAPSPGALNAILEFLRQIYDDNPALARVHAQRYLARTAAWEQDAQGNRSLDNLSTQQQAFRMGLEVFLR